MTWLEIQDWDWTWHQGAYREVLVGTEVVDQAFDHQVLRDPSCLLGPSCRGGRPSSCNQVHPFWSSLA